MSRICLTMIVKDEAHVIERCLSTARDWIDYWVIIDTGSTDGTARVVKEFMEGVPGELLERPWVDFATNRQQVLTMAKMTSDCDYALWLDADEMFTGSPTSRGDLDLTLDGYFLNVDYDGLSYKRLALTSLDKDWQWVGPVHEYLELRDSGTVSGNLDRPRVKVHHDGARAHDPATYAKDANLLEAALEKEPTNTRLRFYYAQSLKDSGEYAAAKDAYEERIALGGWDQEVFISHLQRGRLAEKLGDDDAVDCYMSAYETCPHRAEPLVELARLYREREKFTVARVFARLATDCEAAEDWLFVETACYTWRNWDELALSEWYTGNREVAIGAARTALLANPSDPRLAENLRLMA